MIWPHTVNAVKLVRGNLHEFLQVGAVAQLGERVVRNDEAIGSIPISSTIFSSTYGEPPAALVSWCPISATERGPSVSASGPAA